MVEGSKILTISDIRYTVEIPIDSDGRSAMGPRHREQLHVVDAAGFFWEFSTYTTRRTNPAPGFHVFPITVLVFSRFEWQRYVQYTGAKAGDLFVLKEVESGGFGEIKHRIELTKN